jgi:hypothetical protein
MKPNKIVFLSATNALNVPAYLWYGQIIICWHVSSYQPPPTEKRRNPPTPEASGCQLTTANRKKAQAPDNRQLKKMNFSFTKIHFLTIFAPT